MNLSILFVTISLFISIFSGILLVKEQNKLSFNNLNHDQKTYAVMLIYSNIYLLFCTGMILLSEIWYKIILCSNNDNNSIYSFGFFKIIFVLSGFVSIFYLFIHQIKYNDYIDDKIDTCSWLLIGNMIFILLVSFICKCIISKNKNGYRNIIHDNDEIDRKD